MSNFPWPVEIPTSDMPPQVVGHDGAPVELAPRSGVFRRQLRWASGSAILLSAPRGAAGHERLERLVKAISSPGSPIVPHVVLGSSSSAEGTWLILSDSADTIASRRTSVIVDAQAGPGSLASCLTTLHATLDILEALGCDQGEAPSGVDWLSQDPDGRWGLNPIDPGVWTVDAGRNWRLAVYDVVWTVALGRKPTMHDQPPYRVIKDCPAWLSDCLVRLAGHGGEAIRSIHHARQALRNSRSRRNLKRLAVVASIVAAIAVATIWWADARTVRVAMGIAGQSDRSNFERRKELVDLMARQPVLLFGGGTVEALLEQLNNDCETAIRNWKSLAAELFRADNPNNTETVNRFQALIDQAEPFKAEVAVVASDLQRRLAHVRAAMLLESSDPPAAAVIEAAKELRSHGQYSNDLLERLKKALDERRWKQVSAAPPDGATVREVDQHLVSLREYLADTDADAAFGEKYRGHAGVAEDRIARTLEQRQRAKLAELDQLIDEGRRARNLAVAVARLLQLRLEPDQPESFRTMLKQRASQLSDLQGAKLKAMKEAKAPLPDVAKAILDWEKQVRGDPEAFPAANIGRLAIDFVAQDFARAIVSAEDTSGLPAAGDLVRGALSLASGALQEQLLYAHALQTSWLRPVQGDRNWNHRWHASWLILQASEQLGLKWDGEVHRYSAKAIRVQLLTVVEDHWGNDWIVSIDPVEGFGIMGAGVEISSDLARAIDYQLPIHADEDLFVPGGYAADITVWDDNFGPNDPILLRGKLIFRKNGIFVQAESGSAGAVRVELVP